MGSGAEHIQPRRRQACKVHYADAQAEAMLCAHTAELCRPEAHGWEQVKHNPSRTVYRGVVDGQVIYLKHFHRRSLLRNIARRLGFCDARRELTVAKYLESRGVAASPVLAAAWSGRREWVASREVAPARQGDQWHCDQLARGPEGMARIRSVSTALAEMLARMHAAGVMHRDLHCGNIMVREGGDAVSAELVLVDLHCVSRYRRLSRRRRAANLAQLCYDRLPFTTRGRRLRFLKEYLRFSSAAGTLSGWEMLVWFFAAGHARRQHAHHDRRIFRTNRYFACLDLPGRWCGHIVRAVKREIPGSRAADMTFRDEDWRETLRDIPALASAEGGRAIKQSRSGTVVRRTLSVGGQELDVFVKRPLRKRWWKAVVDCFRPSRSVRAFRKGHELLTRRFLTPLPLAVFERRRGRALLDSVLITEAVECPRLEDFLIDRLAGRGEGETAADCRKRWVSAHRGLWALGRMLQRLHDAGFSHRDLKAVNLLIHGAEAEQEEPVLVDLDGLSRVRLLTVRRRMKDLARLDAALRRVPNVTSAGRLRTLLGYLTRPGSGRVAFKTSWRVIERWSDEWIRRRDESRSRRETP